MKRASEKEDTNSMKKLKIDNLHKDVSGLASSDSSDHDEFHHNYFMAKEKQRLEEYKFCLNSSDSEEEIIKSSSQVDNNTNDIYSIDSNDNSMDFKQSQKGISQSNSAITIIDDNDDDDDDDEQVDITTIDTPRLIAVRNHPERQSRRKVATYNDILNSMASNQFESDFRSEDDDDFENTQTYYTTRYSQNPTDIMQLKNREKLIKMNMKPLGKRRFLKTGFVYDTVMSYHATPDPMEIHPEDPSRIFRIFNILEQHELLAECKRIKSRRATKQEILLAHNIVHYRNLRKTSDLKSRDEYLAMENHYNSIYLNSNSFESALYAAGSLINLMEAVVNNQVKNAFAIIRPPGHHAETDIPMGFCLFNNVAIATKNCMHKLGVKKTLIIDWDIHFGNGTQNIFSEDPNVLYISLHRFDGLSFYPSDPKGSVSYTGHGKGEGKTVNIPWTCAGMTDADYVYAFREIVMPIAVEFDPDIVIVSAGFDAALNDPIGRCMVTPSGYGQMTYMLKSLADGKLVIALEGGYNLDSIAVSALACMNVLLGESPQPIQADLDPKKECLDVVKSVKKVQKKYWRCFN